MDDCIFCKIINGEIPSITVYEDKQVKAFLDISQGTPGHTLLVPKKHVPDIFAYDQQLAETVFARLPKLARAIKKSNPAIKGMNIVNNNGEIAYQSVFHSHIHLIPRYSENDDFQMVFKDNSANYSTEQLQAIAQTIKNQLEV
ncbi:MAG: HIT family protein [Liquorilactobacillus nagelii]|jgi:histidine triad (HIT) family protein|uniref:HIT family protein n=1 Tax=Liquorilactobacillus nagelii TaxID=82688 RepID=UPI0006EEB371|nr:HIT family protein [Liquorilactobacillus nagelii]KRL39994.1 histidine triad (HIT) protein [Liquorilactobacillus nagelii DSM 13675]MCI1634382.1 HIT family protein [Liquorilactobacillus nagelii]MCI1699271.1 HIT family protein [Liquorilactobacillus nagelii]MCI1920290.1 HIT family protein [Liquorilactobacillus nagelii]MCI1975934.1 HIT family protein [Liquorilactobacillus nagelii]